LHKHLAEFYFRLEPGKSQNSNYFDVVPNTVLQKSKSISTPDVSCMNNDVITGVLINDNRNNKMQTESILKNKISPKTSPTVEKKLLFKEV